MEDIRKVRLTIDGKDVIVEEGTTILDAARKNDIYIPTLCHHPALSGWGGCRICVVEVDGAPRLVASCVMPVREGMQVVTSNERIIEARRTVLEFLFAERNHYCMFCAQSGDCELQKLAYELQMDHLTVAFSFNRFPVDATNEYMALDHNRCILCGRCVRACRELAGNYVLNYQNRGARTLICKDLNQMTEESTCDASGICMQVCPTGAIFSRYRTHHAVKGKGKDIKKIDSRCPQCGLLCPAQYFVKGNNLIKIDGLISMERPDRGQLCRRGRFEPLKNKGKRLLKPMIRGKDGKWAYTTWERALDLIAEKMKRGKKEGSGDAIFGFVSEQCSNEEILLFKDLMNKGWNAPSVEALSGSHLKTIHEAFAEIRKDFLALKEASWKEIPDADYILFAGADPDTSQPLIASLARRAVVERGAKIGVVGPRDAMRPWTAHYFSPKKGTEISFFKALLAEAVSYIPKPAQPVHMEEISRELGKVNVEDLLKKTGLEEEERKAFKAMVNSFCDAKAPMIVAGDWVTGLGDCKCLKYLMHLALLKDLLPESTLRLVILKQNGNSSCAMKLGLWTDRKKIAEKRWERGLILLTGEEDISKTRLPELLSECKFLAVITPYFHEAISDKAHILIPRPLWLEEEGTYTSLDGRKIEKTVRVLDPPPGVKSTWETLVTLAQRTDFHPDFDTWEALSAKVRDQLVL
jgi:formate dehydrogenase major subunit